MFHSTAAWAFDNKADAPRSWRKSLLNLSEGKGKQQNLNTNSSKPYINYRSLSSVESCASLKTESKNQYNRHPGHNVKNAKSRREKILRSLSEQSNTNNKMLNPDNCIKARICSKLNIKEDWLDDTNAMSRFKKDKIEEIMCIDRNSNKSFNVLKTYK